MADIEVSEDPALSDVGGAGPDLLRSELIVAILRAEDDELVVGDGALVLCTRLAQSREDAGLFQYRFVRILRRPLAGPFSLLVLDLGVLPAVIDDLDVSAPLRRVF